MPIVDSGNGIRTASQVISNISIMTSVGSILAGLLLIRQNRAQPRNNVEEAVCLWLGSVSLYEN